MQSHATSENTQRVELSQRIFRNTMMISLGEGIIKLLNVVFNIMTVRFLGEVGLGQYATVLAFVGLFGIFLDLGLAQYVTRTIAQDRSKAAELFWNLLVLRLILALTGLALIPFLASVSAYPSQIVLGTLLYAVTFVFSSVLTPLTCVLEAHERFDVTSLVAVIGQLISGLLGIFLLWSGYGFLALLCVGFVAMQFQIVISLRALRRQRLAQLPLHVTPARWPALIRASFPFGLTSLALMLNFNADSIILSWYHPSQEIGWYNAAYRLIFSIVGLGSGFLTAMTPSIANEYVQNPTRVHAWTRTTLTWLALFALPAMLGVALLSRQLIELLYGSAFLPSSMSLMILSMDIPLLLLTAFSGNITAAVGLERPAARIYTISVILNVVLNLALIPSFGMLAASAVTIITDLLSAIAFFALLHRHMQLAAITPRILRISLAAGLMGGLVWAIQALPLLVVIPVAALLYLGLIWKLNVIGQEELRKLQKFLPKRHIP